MLGKAYTEEQVGTTIFFKFRWIWKQKKHKKKLS